MSAISLHTLDSSSASIEIKTAAGQALAIDGSGFITANLASGTEVSLSAASLAALETINAVQSGTWTVEIGATSLAALESVTVVDGGGSLTVDGEVSLSAATLAALETVTVVQGGFSSWQVAVESITSTGAEVVATPLANRIKVIIENVGAADVYLGPATGVTSANGFKLPKGTSIEIELNATANLWAITASGTSSLRIVELAA